MTTTVTKAAYSSNAMPTVFNEAYASVASVLSSQWLGCGPIAAEFEAQLARYVGAGRVISTSSGTSALQIALRCAGVGPGDDVVMPSFTFCACPQAAAMCGARPVFADIDANTLCTTSDHIMNALTPRTRAVMPVLFGGRPVDLSDISDVLEARGIAVVEDAAHAFGSKYLGGALVGSGPNLTCFSFDPIKNLTCGEGGAIAFSEANAKQGSSLATKLRTLGIDDTIGDRRSGSITYVVDEIGFRAHMSDINAAIGLVGLGHFNETSSCRVNLWREYQRHLESIPGVRLVDVDIDRAVPFNCVIRVPNRDSVFARLRTRNIGVGVHYPPNHLQPAFRSSGYKRLPNTEEVATEVLSLPFHTRMAEADVEHVVTSVRQCIRQK